MTTLLVAAFLIPAAVSVLAALWAWLTLRRDPPLPAWKSQINGLGLIAACLGLLLETAFLIRSFAFSDLPSPSLAWMLSGWIAVLTWGIAIIAVILGRGRIRWFLLSYVLTSILGVLLLLGMMD